jgi:hypothetical protein
MDTVRISTLSAMFGCTERQARNLLQEAGVLPVSRGEWDAVVAVRSVFARLRDARTSTELSRARARQVEAVAKKHELATRRAERELVPVEDATAALDLVFGKIASELSALPARLTRDREQRRKIETEINDTRLRMADALKDSAEFLANGGELPHHYEIR